MASLRLSSGQVFICELILGEQLGTNEYFRAGMIHESIMASNKRNQRRGSISITVSIMLPREVSICNFFQLNVEVIGSAIADLGLLTFI